MTYTKNRLALRGFTKRFRDDAFSADRVAPSSSVGCTFGVGHSDVYSQQELNAEGRKRLCPDTRAECAFFACDGYLERHGTLLRSARPERHKYTEKSCQLDD